MKHTFVLLIRFLIFTALLILVGIPAYADLINDYFDDNILNSSLWEIMIDGNGSISEVNQRLELTIETSPGPETSIVAAVLRGTITGDFDVMIDYELFPPYLPKNTGGEPAVAFVVLGTDYFVSREVHDGMDKYSADLGPGEPRVDAYYTSGSLRLTRTGINVTASYLEGYSGWQEIITTTNYLVEPISSLALVGVIDDPDYPGNFSAAFDNFRLEADQFTPIPEPASILLFSTGLGALGLVVCRHKKGNNS